MDVSSQSLGDFADDFSDQTGNSRQQSVGNDDNDELPLGDFLVDVGGEEQQLASQEEGGLVGLTPALSACQNLADIFGNDFSGKISDEPVFVGKDVDEHDKVTNALSDQLDKYLLQFNQTNQQMRQSSFSLEEELDESFDNLFPGLDFQ